MRVDIKVLNHSGNILDASSLAAITALAHFKRPDVSVDDGKITIVSERKYFISNEPHEWSAFSQVLLFVIQLS